MVGGRVTLGLPSPQINGQNIGYIDNCYTNGCSYHPRIQTIFNNTC